MATRHTRPLGDFSNISSVCAGLQRVRSRCDTFRIAARLSPLSCSPQRYVGADISQLTMEAALQCIRESMGALDLDADELDSSILESMAVTSLSRCIAKLPSRACPLVDLAQFLFIAPLGRLPRAR